MSRAPTVPPQPVAGSANVNALRLRRRYDLAVVSTRHKNESAVVIKDPIALKYHRLRPDEYFVLELLDGTRTLSQIRDAYQKRWAPQKVKLTEINQLLFRFHQNGLTQSDAAGQGDRLSERRWTDRKRKWMQSISGVLFIRFPGIDPEPILRGLYPIARPIMGWFGTCLALLVCVLAGATFLIQWERFHAEFPAMHQWLRLESIIVLAAVIGGTKVLHELGHAITCKHFGGECHQIGPMLLVFAPALYCDTSDSWMLPSRWQRAMVGMAGIATEVFLAAIATFVWANTGPGLPHYVAMNVMLVCGVSTVLFNANPLLRYDGYYVLSDLCDVPNLGERSRKLLAGDFNRLFLGVDEPSEEAYSRSTRFWLTVYGFAATTYRWGLTLLILWFVSLILRPYRLESVGKMLCAFAAGGLLFTLLRNPYHFLRHPARRRLIRMKRVLTSLCLLSLVIAGAMYPLPSGESAEGRIIPRSETVVYVSSPGHLSELLRGPGQLVSQDDVIAVLTNPDVELQRLEIQGRRDTQKQLVEALRRSQLDSPDAANELPSAEALLADLETQLRTREKRVEALSIRAPASGKLLAAPRRKNPVPSDQETRVSLVNWSGDPTEVENRGCFLESGVELMSIAADDQWDVELVMTQTQIERIDLGAEVKLVLESTPEQTITGTLTDISRSQWTAPDNAYRRDDPDAVRQGQPVTTSYVVRVELSPTDLPLITGAAVAARVHAEPISLFGRGSRLINRLLRFR